MPYYQCIKFSKYFVIVKLLVTSKSSNSNSQRINTHGPCKHRQIAFLFMHFDNYIWDLLHLLLVSSMKKILGHPIFIVVTN